jgi:hypothetical protein
MIAAMGHNGHGAVDRFHRPVRESIMCFTPTRLRRRQMEVHLFRGTGRIFGFTEDRSGANLPSQYGPWSPFKVLDMNRHGDPIPGVNTEACLTDIERYGLHVTDAHARITESVL